MKTAEEIKHAVLRELAWDTRVEVAKVGVEVNEGVVTLTGAVSSYGEKMAAQEAAHRVACVHDVVNAIQEALWRRATREANHIEVSVENGQVTLSGRVQSAQEKRAILGTIRHAPGVKAIHDQLLVSPSVQ